MQRVGAPVQKPSQSRGSNDRPNAIEHRKLNQRSTFLNDVSQSCKVRRCSGDTGRDFRIDRGIAETRNEQDALW